MVWLQFWIVSSSFSYVTEFMDTISEHSPMVANHWYEMEFFITLWLVLPWTDGSTLLCDKVCTCSCIGSCTCTNLLSTPLDVYLIELTVWVVWFPKITIPLLAPLSQHAKHIMDSNVILLWIAFINSGYLWILWITFMTLPEPARRFVTVAVGTIYPILASTVCIATNNNKLNTSSFSSQRNNRPVQTNHEETFWLTYWCCYSILFVMMDYLETFVGSIPGFYSICLCATVYL
jgi:hypothetical protein